MSKSDVVCASKKWWGFVVYPKSGVVVLCIKKGVNLLYTGGCTSRGEM
jgi:hypothetical protein